MTFSFDLPDEPVTATPFSSADFGVPVYNSLGYLKEVADAMGCQLIDSDTLASDGSFDFSSIPATFTNLKIVVMGRGDAAAVGDTVYVRLNGDTGNNYDVFGWVDTNGTVTKVDSRGTAQFTAGYVTAGSATANYPGWLEITIPNYATTTFNKSLQSVNDRLPSDSATTNSLTAILSGVWKSTNAINRVQIYLAGGDFITGSTASLYGLL